MGLFHLRCQASGVGLVTESVVLVLVAKYDHDWVPIALPIRGEYDTYGSIDHIAFGASTARTLAGFTTLLERGELVVPTDDPRSAFGHVGTVAGLRGLLEHVRQGLIIEAFRGETPSQLVRARGHELGFVVILEALYDEAVDLTCLHTPAGIALYERLAAADRATRIEGAFGDHELAIELLDDTHDTHTGLLELAMFRLWFDARGSWEPRYETGQYSPAELRVMVAAAKQALAEWPKLVQVVDSYKQLSLRIDDD